MIPNIKLIEIIHRISARKVTCYWLEDRSVTSRGDICNLSVASVQGAVFLPSVRCV